MQPLHKVGLLAVWQDQLQVRTDRYEISLLNRKQSPGCLCGQQTKHPYQGCFVGRTPAHFFASHERVWKDRRQYVKMQNTTREITMKQNKNGSYEKALASIERRMRENVIRKKAAEGRRWQQERERRRCAFTMTEFAAKYGGR